LLAGQSYSWNVAACNVGSCSGYNGQWWRFRTAQTPLQQASGAGTSWVVNPDCGGTPLGGWLTQPAGWTVAAPTQNAPYTCTATSSPLTLDFRAACSGAACAILRLDYQLVHNVVSSTGYDQYSQPSACQIDNGSSITVSWLGTTLLSYQLPTSSLCTAGGFVERDVVLPATAGATGQLVFALTGAPNSQGAAHYPALAVVDRLDGPTAKGVPAVGLAAEPRFPRQLAASAGAGVDTVTGALTLAASDLAVPGWRAASASAAPAARAACCRRGRRRRWAPAGA
jgi:hypothetical protein